MKKYNLGAAVAAAFGVAASANAADVVLTIVGETSESANGSSISNVSASTATWLYNTSSGVVTGTGNYSTKSQINPNKPGSLFSRNIADVVFGGGVEPPPPPQAGANARARQPRTKSVVRMGGSWTLGGDT